MAELVGVTGRVIAYEAIPTLAEKIRRITINLPQVEVLNFAVCDRSEISKFKWAKAGDGYSGLREREMPETARVSIVDIDVQTTTLDESLQNAVHEKVGSLRFMKMDIEGGEYHAFVGARKTIALLQPFVIFENGRERMAQLYEYTKEQWFDLFASMNYSTFDLFGRPFGIENWSDDHMPWYTIAVPANSEHEAYVREVLPHRIREMETSPEIALSRPREP